MVANSWWTSIQSRSKIGNRWNKFEIFILNSIGLSLTSICSAVSNQHEILSQCSWFCSTLYFVPKLLPTKPFNKYLLVDVYYIASTNVHWPGNLMVQSFTRWSLQRFAICFAGISHQQTFRSNRCNSAARSKQVGIFLRLKLSVNDVIGGWE